MNRVKTNTKRARCKLPYCTEHQIWAGMWRRCHGPHDPAFERYGGRGITVCERWRDFFVFVEDMGRRPSANHSLDRIDGTKGYSPDNCRWATLIEQAANRSSVVLITIDGVTRPHKTWCDLLGVTRDASLARFTECGDWKQAFELAKYSRCEQRKELVEINGETRSIAGWCKLLQIPIGIVWKKITADKQPPAQAIRSALEILAAPRYRKLKVTLWGVTKHLHQWCEETGIDVGSAVRRYGRFGSWEQALSLKGSLASSASITLTAFDRTQTIAEWAKEKELQPKVIWQRIHRDKMTPEEAVGNGKEYIYRKSTIGVTIDGVTKSINAWCKHFGMPRSRARHRFEKFGSWEAAFEPENREARTTES